MNLTKYSNLTDDELITEALVILTNEDELALELLSRLMDTKDELDRWKCDFNDEMGYWVEKTTALRYEIEVLRDMSKPQGDIEGVPV